jgi:hypothetical protein
VQTTTTGAVTAQEFYESGGVGIVIEDGAVREG